MRLSHVLAAAFLAAGCNSKPPQPPAQAALEPPKAVPDSSLERADKARIQGSENAKVWLVIASDFQCPYCKAFHDDAYKQIVANYVVPGKVRVAYLNHPMSMHVHGMISAEAAMCAGMQNRFWQMHDGLFETQEHWSQLADPRPVFDSLASSLKLDLPEWRGCMTSHKSRPMIDSDNTRTTAGGVGGTPSFFIADKLVSFHAEPYKVFRAALDSALAVRLATPIERAGPPRGGGRHP